MLGFAASTAAVQAAPPLSSVHFLSCAYGSVGVWPLNAGPRPQYAEAVVDVAAYARAYDLPSPAITIVDRTGKPTGTRDVEYIRQWVDAAKPWNGTKPWDGILKVGTTRLRVRVRLNTTDENFSAFGGTCILNFAGRQVRRPVDGEWPT